MITFRILSFIRIIWLTIMRLMCHLLNALEIMSLCDVTTEFLVISSTSIYFSFYWSTITQTILFSIGKIFMIISYYLSSIVNMKFEINYLLFAFLSYVLYHCDLIFIFMIYLLKIVVSFSVCSFMLIGSRYFSSVDCSLIFNWVDRFLSFLVIT